MLAKDEILQGRYRIVSRLGHGGMGAVYEAKDERLGSAVALKEITIELDKIPTASQQDIFRRAFEREAKLLANLYHEVFPRVMDYFSEENRQFLIMEMVAGDDLSEGLKKNKSPFALDAALQWADHLLDALDYLHTQTPPIFHRDIKPQNLKITPRGRVKLLDFGIAKTLDHGGSTLTNQTFIGATLDYAPIEQTLPAITPTFREFIILKHKAKAAAVLAQSTDARCDLYAVGATFYHLLTNRVPVDSAKRTLDVWEGSEDPLPCPSKVNPDIPPPISAWLLKALEIEREDRFASAVEMQKALHAAIEQSAAETIRPQSQIATQPQITLASQTEPSQSLTLPEVVTEFKTQEALTEFRTQEVATEDLTKVISKPGSSREVTAVSDEKPTRERRLAPAPAKSGFGIFWLAAVFAAGLLAIIGIGSGMYLMNGASPATSGSAAANEKAASPTPPPPSNQRQNETGANRTTAPDVSPAKTPASTPPPATPPKAVEDDNPKPPPAPNKTPAMQNPVGTPAARKTPKVKASQDPNCVFTNSCQ